MSRRDGAKEDPSVTSTVTPGMPMARNQADTVIADRIPEVAGTLGAGGETSGAPLDLDRMTFLPVDDLQEVTGTLVAGGPHGGIMPTGQDAASGLLIPEVASTLMSNERGGLPHNADLTYIPEREVLRDTVGTLHTRGDIHDSQDDDDPRLVIESAGTGYQADQLVGEAGVVPTLSAENRVPHAMTFQPSVARNGRGGPAEVTGPLLEGHHPGSDVAPLVYQDEVPVGFHSNASFGATGQDIAPTMSAVAGAVPSVAYRKATRPHGPEGSGLELERWEETEAAGTLTGHGTTTGEAVAFAQQQTPKGFSSETAPTLQGSQTQHGVARSMAVRRLTPLECERLQGFPDGWTDLLADSPRYRVLGNAICVNVAEWIARRLVRQL